MYTQYSLSSFECIIVDFKKSRYLVLRYRNCKFAYDTPAPDTSSILVSSRLLLLIIHGFVRRLKIMTDNPTLFSCDNVLNLHVFCVIYMFMIGTIFI